MALPTGVHKRGAVFHIQIKVPGDIRSSWPTPFYVRKSLGTEDRAAATAQAHRLWVEATDAFAQARARSKPPELTTLTPALAACIVAEVSHSVLGADDVLRFEPGRALALLRSLETPPVRYFSAEGSGALNVETPAYLEPSEDGSMTLAQLDRLKALQQAIVEDLGSALSLGRLNVAREAAEVACSGLGLRIDWMSPSHRPTLIAVLRALLGAWIGTADRSAGTLVTTPVKPERPEVRASEPAPAPQAKSAKPQHLADMLPLWIKKSAPKADSIERTKRALKLLEESGKDVPLKAMTKGQGFAFQAYLTDKEARGFGGKTAMNYAGCISALLRIAVKADLADKNPWPDLTDFEIKDSKKRDDFTNEELKKLFGSKLFTEGEWPTVQKVDPKDAYHALLLSLWSGARSSEIAQLEVADVMTENGIALFSIHAEAEGSTVKTAESVRKVPVSAECIRLGFLEFAQARKEAGEAKLFPSFHREGKVTPGEIFSEWMRDYRAQVGTAPGALNGHHRFRHTIRTALAALHVGIETADALTGHAATGSSGRRVYTHVGLATVREALGRVAFPLDLPNVYKAPSGAYEPSPMT